VDAAVRVADHVAAIERLGPLVDAAGAAAFQQQYAQL